jgi:hypothetical protein
VDSPNLEKSHLNLTKESGYYEINDTQDLYQSQKDREDGLYTDSYEGEESEISDYESQSNLGYNRETIESNSNSYIDHTNSQFIKDQELTSGVLFRQSQGENTLEQHIHSYENSEGEYEQEESEEDNNDSEAISGIESLSQSIKTKTSKSQFKQSQR